MRTYGCATARSYARATSMQAGQLPDKAERAAAEVAPQCKLFSKSASMTCLPSTARALGRTRKSDPGYDSDSIPIAMDEAYSYSIINDKSHLINYPEVVQTRVKDLPVGEVMATLKVAVTTALTNDRGEMRHTMIHNTQGDAKALCYCRDSPPREDDNHPKEHRASCGMHGKLEPRLTKGNVRGANDALVGMDEGTCNRAGVPKSRYWPASNETSMDSQMVDMRHQDIPDYVGNLVLQEKQGDQPEVQIKDDNVQAKPPQAGLLHAWYYSSRHLRSQRLSRWI
jgi:hypothetical protein